MTLLLIKFSTKILMEMFMDEDVDVVAADVDVVQLFKLPKTCPKIFLWKYILMAVVAVVPIHQTG